MQARVLNIAWTGYSMSQIQQIFLLTEGGDTIFLISAFCLQASNTQLILLLGNNIEGVLGCGIRGETRKFCYADGNSFHQQRLLCDPITFSVTALPNYWGGGIQFCLQKLNFSIIQTNLKYSGSSGNTGKCATMIPGVHTTFPGSFWQKACQLN